jgi:hypothetical protein
MDDIVRRALARWPDVPAVYGWLNLDRRGRWLIRGETISNPQVNAFIGRNYEHDAQGRWYFQNGPQRVFVTLAYLPFVYRLTETMSATLATHNGRPVERVAAAWIDDAGALVLATEHGPGSLDDRDLESLLPCFVGNDDAKLNDDEIDACFERLQVGEDARLRFRYRSSSVPVYPLACAGAARKFGIVSAPVEPD